MASASFAAASSAGALGAGASGRGCGRGVGMKRSRWPIFQTGISGKVRLVAGTAVLSTSDASVQSSPVV